MIHELATRIAVKTGKPSIYKIADQEIREWLAEKIDKLSNKSTQNYYDLKASHMTLTWREINDILNFTESNVNKDSAIKESGPKVEQEWCEHVLIGDMLDRGWKFCPKCGQRPPERSPEDELAKKLKEHIKDINWDDDEGWDVKRFARTAIQWCRENLK